MYFRYFVIISLWRATGPFIWTNLNPLHPRIHFESLVEIGPLVQEKKIFKFRQCIDILWLSPVENGWGPLFEHSWIPFTQRWIVSSLVELVQRLLRKRWKYYDHDNDNDDGQRTNLIQKSSLEPSAQVS